MPLDDNISFTIFLRYRAETFGDGEREKNNEAFSIPPFVSHP